MKHRRYLGLFAMLVLAAACQSQCGCFQSDMTREGHRRTTDTYTGSVTVPVPSMHDGAAVLVPTDIPFTLTRTSEETTDEAERTKSGLDPAAMAQLGGALAGSLKQAFPALAFLGAPAGGGSDWTTLLGTGGGGALLMGAGGIALRTLEKRAKAKEDAAWDEAEAAKIAHARAEERAKALAEAKA